MVIFAGTEGDQDAKQDAQKADAISNAGFKFRNYKPLDSDLSRFVVDLSPALDIAEELREVLEEARKFQEVKEIDLASLAPKKVDWDLKRDVQKKLDKLERRTQRAIIELIRQRLQAGSSELLVPAMNYGAKAAEEGHMSDED
uniref:Cwf18 pre-mRNA splicing factor n=1 Tax=Trichuris muris TaxID=70415 RepID=A0A5S6QI99_TRIMR